MLESIDSREWSAWEALYYAEGFGEAALERRFAQLRADMLNVAGKIVRDSVAPADLMLNPWRLPKELPADDLDEKIRHRMLMFQ